MSQTLSPSFARCYGLARVARAWKISRASGNHYDRPGHHDPQRRQLHSPKSNPQSDKLLGGLV